MILRKNYIYRYRYNQNTPLCIYLCDTQSKNRILIVPLTESSEGNVYKLSITRQYAVMDSYLEINTDDIISALYLNSNPVRIPDADIAVISKSVLNHLMDDIYSNVHKSNTSQILFESLYQFLKWKQQKLLLNFSPYTHKTDIYENGIYWASLGVNVGSELNKSRPVLVWKKRCNGDNEENFSYIVIPITSKGKSKKYYMNVPIDIDGRSCYLRIEDMRRINIKRFLRPLRSSQNRIIFIDTAKRQEIMEAIRHFYIFDNSHE